ncbi:MAG: hypothetical protein H7Y31_08625 [Chitinophagaceae bacterium]|nr:hypothetical protein [Chitinophagaceae bacterium]
MKKIMLVIVAFIVSFAATAQSEKYQKAMAQFIPAVDSIHTPDGWREVANSFQRIADAEKTQWLPYYYAAFSHVMAGYSLATGGGAFATKTDPEADVAEQLLNKADELSKDNSEIYCVKKMIASLRLMADPMNRYQTQLPLAGEALAKAKTLDPANPRPTLLEAQDKFYTPEEYGGSKAEAKVLFEEAGKKFESFKPQSAIHPQWGKSQIGYFLSQFK